MYFSYTTIYRFVSILLRRAANVQVSVLVEGFGHTLLVCSFALPFLVTKARHAIAQTFIFVFVLAAPQHLSGRPARIVTPLIVFDTLCGFECVASVFGELLSHHPLLVALELVAAIGPFFTGRRTFILLAPWFFPIVLAARGIIGFPKHLSRGVAPERVAAVGPRHAIGRAPSIEALRFARIGAWFIAAAQLELAIADITAVVPRFTTVRRTLAYILGCKG